MRRLWIQRHKALAACAAKMKIYIEDPQQGELDINGVLCRKLGEIRNGERKSFSIGYETARVYVIADKVSRNAYHEFCRIPAGMDDVFLAGRNYFAPFSGNPFRFDGEAEKDTAQNRKRVKGRGRGILIISLLVGLLVGGLVGKTVGTAIGKSIGSAMAEASARPQVFSVDGMEITLTSAYSELDMDGFIASFGSYDTVVFVTKEPFSMAAGSEMLTLEAYGALILQNNAMGLTAQIRSSDGLTWFEYDYQNPETGEDMNYFTVLYKGPDAFWMVQFVTGAYHAAETRQEFFGYAKSVVLGESL